MQRALERRIVVLAMGLAVFFTAWVLVWRFAYGSDPFDLWWYLPPLPRMRGLEAFDLLLYLVPIADVAILAMLASFVLRWVTRWRGTTAWIPTFLPILVCLLAAAVHVPFWGASERRIDRVLGEIEVPVPQVRSLATLVVVTLTLAAMFIAVTRQRRAPASAKQAALVTSTMLCGVLLHLYWILLVFPMTSEWWPGARDSELLVPLRPCRGALVWMASGDHTHPFGRIDDVWLQFADPRIRDERVWAISVRGEWREEYVWLNRSEAAQLYVRRDDPLIVQCELRPRSENVAPAQWHKLGLDRMGSTAARPQL